MEDSVPTIAHRLTSFDTDGKVIGDDRDYDLLKAVMTPLESLAEHEPGDPLEVTLDVPRSKVTMT